MLDVIEEYKTLSYSLNDIIKVSGYGENYLSEQLNMSEKIFNIKRKRSFTDDEMEKLCRLFNTEQIEDYLFGKMMEETIKEEGNERVGIEELMRILNIP